MLVEDMPPRADGVVGCTREDSCGGGGGGRGDSGENERLRARFFARRLAANALSIGVRTGGRRAGGESSVRGVERQATE